ncbi:Codeine O-demethylase [Morus notabilis]|uniref:Codeine O-demethylase n=1 Tax=Morus notabilis TaxID=981085 RepID=W9R2C3_9ROSA|nr:Codeine O-demethylase [Morus notabilis]
MLREELLCKGVWHCLKEYFISKISISLVTPYLFRTTTLLVVRSNTRWIFVKPVRNALVVNICDATEAWSNGMYKSIENRAVKNANKARMSIAAFVFSDDDAADIGPVESMILDLPKMYSNVKKVDYFRHRLAKKLEGKDDKNFLKLESQS